MPLPFEAKVPRRRRERHLLLAMLLLCAGLLLVPGCGGCWSSGQTAQSDEEKAKEKEKKKKEERKPDYEIERIVVQPPDATIKLNGVKPGHWVSASVEARANNFPARFDLESRTVNKAGATYGIDYTPYELVMSRPGALAKGQTKSLEAIYYIPPPDDRQGREKSVRLRAEMLSDKSGNLLKDHIEPTSALEEYQYLFIVLAPQPDSYSFLGLLHAFRPPQKSFNEPRFQVYTLIKPKLDKTVDLPSTSLTWTSIAYLLWDGVDPQLLSHDQQNALIDWLQWGGQLLVSGPDSLNLLKGSFLDPYLPAARTDARELTREDFASISSNWSPERGVRRPIEIEAGQPRLGALLALKNGGQEMSGTGGLVVEGRAGRGRVVVTAFSLDDRRLQTWGGFDGFLNGCLLRRPGRSFHYNEQLDESPYVTVRGGQETTPFKEALLATTLRFFSRDLAPVEDSAGNSNPLDDRTKADASGGESPARFELPAEAPLAADARPRKSPDTWHYGGYTERSFSGVAGWNSFSGVSEAARGSLRKAAGIKPPQDGRWLKFPGGFVLEVMGIYLLALVPLNWGFFRLIRHVEWAWIAAPLIAVAGAICVVYFAQLDIGFARARTEVGVLEIHGGYERAHLTRYSALYSSLSTGYEVRFDDSTALAQPFPSKRDRDQPVRRSAVRFRRDNDVRLSGYQVESNSMSMLHSEQMHPLKGSIQLADQDSEWKIESTTPLSLHDAAVLRRRGGLVEIAWIGDFAGKTTTAPLVFEAAGEKPWARQWDASPVVAEEMSDVVGEVGLWRLFQLAAQRLELGEGESRLVAWTDEELGDITFRPGASQKTLRTLVLVHLSPAALSAPQRDVNHIDDVSPETPESRVERDPDADPFEPR